MATSNKRRTANQSSGRRSEGSDDYSDEGGALGLASRVAGKAKDVVKGRLGERVGESVDGLNGLAKTLKLAGQQLEGNIGGSLLEKAGESVERIAHYIEDADARDLLRRAESFGRAKPLLFIGAAAGLGFVGGRFLKASAVPGSSGRERTRARQDRQKEPPRLPPARRGNGSSPIAGERRP